jgi:hypothetical protein
LPPSITSTTNYNSSRVGDFFSFRYPLVNPPQLNAELLTCLVNSLTTVSESYITTDGHSASLSWNKAHIWGLRPDFYYCQAVAGLLMWSALSDERRVCCLQLLLALASAVIFRSQSRGTRNHILLS